MQFHASVGLVISLMQKNNISPLLWHHPCGYNVIEYLSQNWVNSSVVPFISYFGTLSGPGAFSNFCVVIDYSTSCLTIGGTVSYSILLDSNRKLVLYQPHFLFLFLCQSISFCSSLLQDFAYLNDLLLDWICFVLFKNVFHFIFLLFLKCFQVHIFLEFHFLNF